MCETEKNCGLFWKFFVSVLRQKEVSHLALSAYFIISGQETETDARTCQSRDRNQNVICRRFSLQWQAELPGQPVVHATQTVK